jgi:hypothetical protein
MALPPEGLRTHHAALADLAQPDQVDASGEELCGDHVIYIGTTLLIYAGPRSPSRERVDARRARSPPSVPERWSSVALPPPHCRSAEAAAAREPSTSTRRSFLASGAVVEFRSSQHCRARAR